jgi:hypothetical protein
MAPSVGFELALGALAIAQQGTQPVDWFSAALERGEAATLLAARLALHACAHWKLVE